MPKQDIHKIDLTTIEISSIHEVLTWYLNELNNTKIDKETVESCCEADREVAFEQAKQSIKESKKRAKMLISKLSKEIQNTV